MCQCNMRTTVVRPGFLNLQRNICNRRQDVFYLLLLFIIIIYLLLCITQSQQTRDTATQQ